MIITVVCDVLGEENNGTTIACMNLIRGLKKRGHEVRVICSDEDKKGLAGYYVLPEMNLGKLANAIVHRNGVRLAKADKNTIESAIKDCDCVHTTFFLKTTQEAIKIAKKYNKPITASFHVQAENVTCHVGLKNIGWVNSKVYKYFYKHIYRYIDCIHYPTQFIRDVFEKEIGKTTEGIVISNGVNSIFTKKNYNRKKEYEGKFLILNTGRLSSEKNQDILIKAIGKLQNKDQVKLIIAGSGPRKEKLIKLAEKENVDLEINFYSRKELVELINSIDLYVHPAEVEIESIACLEALCCGVVPVIANSKKSATKYFAFDERCLFENKNANSLAEKIEYWMSHPEEKAKYSDEYLVYSKKFEHEECMNQMEKMIVDNYNKKIKKC